MNKIRTIEELEKCNYENLTYGEFVEYELDCKKHCPLFGEYCTGGMVCYGGMPIEPPCTGFKDDTVLVKQYDNYVAADMRDEEYREKQEELERLNAEKKAERKRKRFEYLRRNTKEIDEIRQLNKYINRVRKHIRTLESFIEATNITNKIFRECGCDCPPDIQKSERIIEKENNIKKYENRIAELREIIKQREKKLKKRDKRK